MRLSPSLALLALLLAPHAAAQSVPSWADSPGSEPPSTQASGASSSAGPGTGPTNPGAPGPAPGTVPVDGGLALLALAGAGYAARRLRREALAVALAALGASGAAAQGAVLSPGDVVVVHAYFSNGGSGRGGDNATLLTTVDLPEGTRFMISDGAWDATTQSIRIDDDSSPTEPNRVSDGRISYVAPCDVPAGTLFRFDFDSGTGFDRNSNHTCSGTATDAASGMTTTGTFQSLNGSGDQLLIFQDATLSGNQTGTNPPSGIPGNSASSFPRFVFAVTTRNDFITSGVPTRNETYLPPLLDRGSTALFIPTANTVFKGLGTVTGTPQAANGTNDVEVPPQAALQTGSRGALLALVGNVTGNWVGNNVNTGNETTPANENPQSGYLARVRPVSSANRFTVQGNTTAGAATAVGGPGWRTLAVPGGAAVGDLVPINFVQGLRDEHPTDAQGRALVPNLYVGFNGDNADRQRRTAAAGFSVDAFRSNNFGFVPPEAEAAPVQPGKGVLWYFWDVTAGPFAGGSSQSRTLPVLFPGNVGPAPLASGSVAVTHTAEERRSARDGDVRPNEFYFLGNPFGQAFDLSGLSVSAPYALQASFAIWNPNAGGPNGAAGSQVPAGNGTPGSYVVRNDVPTDTQAANRDADDLQVWQGFYACVSGGPATGPAVTSAQLPVFTFADAGRRPNDRPTFYGRTAQTSATLAFQLQGETAEGVTYDEASQLYFNGLGAAGFDPYDLPSMGTMGWPSATLRPLETWHDGAVRPHMQRSLPFALGAPTETPLRLAVEGAGGTYALTWQADDLPDGWTATLIDAEAGETVDLRAATTYAFEAEVGESDRFTVRVAPAGAVAGEDGPDADALAVGPATPNPTASGTRVTVRGLEDAGAEVAVFDALGRRVAVVHRGPAAGAVTVHVPTDGLAPGVYVVRATSGAAVAAARFSVVR